MTLKVVEQNTAMCVQCPSCGRMYDVSKEEERDGRRVNVADLRKAPNECERCGSPMDQKDALKFQDDHAEREADNYGPMEGLKRLKQPPRDTMVREPVESK